MYYRLVRNDKAVRDDALKKVDASTIKWGEVLNRAVLTASEGITKYGAELEGVFKQKDDSLGTDIFYCRFYLPEARVGVEVSFAILKVNEVMQYDRDFFSTADSNEDMTSFFSCYLLMRLQKFCLCLCCGEVEGVGYRKVKGYYRV